MAGLDLVILTVLFSLLVVSAYTDITAGKVYNRYTFPALFLGVILNYWSGGWNHGSANLQSSLWGMALGGGIFCMFYYFGVMGGGDLKLVTAVGALKGAQFVLYAIFYTSLVGAILAVGYLVWRGKLVQGVAKSLKMGVTFRRRELTEAELKDTEPARERIPYGVAISMGTMWAFFVTQRM